MKPSRIFLIVLLSAVSCLAADLTGNWVAENPLPDGSVRKTYFDRSRVGLPLLSGLALALWQIAQDIVGALWQFVSDFLLFKPAAIWALATGAYPSDVR